MNDDDLITAVRESFTDVHSGTPVERIVTECTSVKDSRTAVIKSSSFMMISPARGWGQGHRAAL